MGITKSFLQKEKLRAYEGLVSPDCRDKVCLGCGLQRKEFDQLVSCFSESDSPVNRRAKTGPDSTQPAEGRNFGRYTKKRMVSATPVKKKIRMRYTKTGLARFISHLDVVRLFDRAARRARISLVYSQGFHPRPKIAFGLPLSLGIASTAEYLDLEADVGQNGDFVARLNQVLPAGIQILTQKTIFSKVPSLASVINRVTYQVFLDEVQLDENQLQDFLHQEQIIVQRIVKEETREIDLRPYIQHIEIKGRNLNLSLDAIEGRMVRVTEVLESLLGSQGVDYRSLLVQRTGQFIVKGDKLFEPFELI